MYVCMCMILLGVVARAFHLAQEKNIVCMYVCILCVYVCVYVSMYACVYVCMYVYCELCCV